MSPAAFGQAKDDKPLPGKGDSPASYQIANKKHGDLLRPKDANSQDGTPIVLYPAQSWKCLTWKLAPADNAEFTVQNHFTGKTFGTNAAGDKAVQTPLAEDAEKAVRWRFVKLADGSYRIADPKSGNVLTAVKGENGVSIALQPWQEKDEQKWELRETDPAKLSMHAPAGHAAAVVAANAAVPFIPPRKPRCWAARSSALACRRSHGRRFPARFGLSENRPPI